MAAWVKWTEDEESLLRTHFGKVGREELQKLLPHRTYRGIKQKAVNIGVLKTPTAEELRKLVQDGYSTRAIGAKYDLDGKTIHGYCRKFGIKLLSQPEAAARLHRNELPDHLFTPPLSPKMSWLVGIMTADGNINEREQIRLVSVDKDIPDQCLEVAGVGSVYGQNPSTRNRQRYYVWTYSAEGLAVRLARFGIVPRKTHTITLQDMKDLHPPSYVRGLWDGDGHWRVDKSGYLRAGIGSASRDFIEALWEYLKPIVQSNAKFYKHPSKDHWIIRVDKRRARALVEWMYQDPCEVYCKRKRLIACADRF